MRSRVRVSDRASALLTEVFSGVHHFAQANFWIHPSVNLPPIHLITMQILHSLIVLIIKTMMAHIPQRKLRMRANLEPEGFRPRCMTFRITGFLDFAHRQVS
jgi:hypothetical protein